LNEESCPGTAAPNDFKAIIEFVDSEAIVGSQIVIDVFRVTI
jgi:hypothetical protein